MATTPKKHITILGAGITGLSTALCLLTSTTKPFTPHITIIATHLPTDRSPQYTSPWAGGHWRSHVGPSSSLSESRVRKWDARTYQYWRGLLSPSPSKAFDNSRALEEHLGLGFRESRNFWGAEGPETERGDGRGLWWSKGAVEEFRVLSPVERLPGAVMGVKYKSVCFDPPRYLTYLFEEIKSFSSQVRIIQMEISTDGGLQGVVKGVKAAVPGEEIFCLINCTGLGARKFVEEEEKERLFPVRGQTLLVRGEAKGSRTYTSVPGMGESDILYVVPRPGSGTTILGGCKQVGNWETEIDEPLNERIVQEVKRYEMVSQEDGLLNAEGEFEILAKQVGFRPGRKGGPRVEVEKEGKGRVEGVWVVHSYGHGGGGFQASWGCAEEVVDLIEGLGDA